MLTPVSYDVSGRTYTGFLANGGAAKATPGVLVFHGGDGLTPQTKKRAEMLAELGYVAFVADLFGENPEMGLEGSRKRHQFFRENHHELIARCNGALDILRQQPNVDAKRIATIGYCFGGHVALEHGRSGADLRAIVGFHSGLDTQYPEASVNIKAKVLICQGDQDPFASVAQVNAFMENMTASKVDCQLLMFAGQCHCFTDPYAAGLAAKHNVAGVVYNEAADRRSWAAMQALFDEVFVS
jgi:dienelactone hydrolase